MSLVSNIWILCQNSLPLSNGQNKKIIFMPHQNDTNTATWNKEIKEFVELSTIIHLRERERERGKRTRSDKENRRIERPKLFWVLDAQESKDRS